MSDEMTDNMINVAIVFGKAECNAMREMFLSEELSTLGMNIIGIACDDDHGEVHRYAKQKGIYTTRNFQSLFRLHDLQIIIELTDNPWVSSEILRKKPDHIHFMDHISARLLWSLHQIKEKRISECVAALENSREEAESYWALFDHAVAALYRTRISDGSVLMCNQRLANILGFQDRTEVISKYNVANNYVVRGGRKVLIDELMSRGSVDNFEFRQRRKDGSVFWANLSARIFPEKDYIEGMLMDITDRKRAEEENRFLTQRLIFVQEEERKRIARDLHDELGQALTTFQFGMNVLKGSLPGELIQQGNRCDKMIYDIARLGDRIREISSELRPGMLDQLGLIPALETYVSDINKQNEDIQFHFQNTGFSERLTPEVEITLYRVTQEALNNIMKHAKAKHASIILTLNYPELILTITDDGVGFHPTRYSLSSKRSGAGIGLLGMRERMDSIGGSLDIRSARRKGTIICAKVSVRESHEVTP